MSEPTRLGKYEIVETLGKGAMGVVYRAFDPDIHRSVAIKTIRKDLIDDDERGAMMFARLKNEARAAGRLSHPGIVAVHDYGETGDLTYIAMEFVQGSSLRDYFNGGAHFREHDIVSIMVQLLDGLQHAHEQGVWHRDIKPANLIIMDTGRLKIADFGIAKVDSAQLTQTGLVMGSPGYMAPEQYAGGAVDWRADLFAAGVVMYQLLTGVRAFTGTTEQLAYQICHVTPPPPSEADPGRGWERYDAVVMRALAKDPDARFQTAESFRAAILAACAAPVNATVSVDAIIARAARPTEVFEPSDPSARTFTDVTPPPPVRAIAAATAAASSAGASDAAAPTLTALGIDASGATAAARPGRRNRYIAAGAAAVVIAASVGWFVRGKPEPAPIAPGAALAPKPAVAEARPVAVPEAAKAEEHAEPERPEPAKVPEASAPGRAAPAPRPAPKPVPVAKADAPAAEAPTGFWRDQGINTKVAAQLHFNRKLWGTGIQPETKGGVVTLRGNVPSQELIAEAVRIAGGVSGVRTVRSELRIGVPEQSPREAPANP
jgi:serine/threonine-protein kinase